MTREQQTRADPDKTAALLQYHSALRSKTSMHLCRSDDCLRGLQCRMWPFFTGEGCSIGRTRFAQTILRAVTFSVHLALGASSLP
jgi:hypothetical protein